MIYQKHSAQLTIKFFLKNPKLWVSLKDALHGFSHIFCRKLFIINTESQLCDYGRILDVCSTGFYPGALTVYFFMHMTYLKAWCVDTEGLQNYFENMCYLFFKHLVSVDVDRIPQEWKFLEILIILFETLYRMLNFCC